MSTFIKIGALGLLLLAPSLGAGCIAETADCPTGAETCACTSGGACDPGLQCFSNVCVNASGGADAIGDGTPLSDALGAEVVGPGSVVAVYTLFPRTCEELRLTTVRAQVRNDAGDIDNEATLPCANNGEITIDPVSPGTHIVIIEGLDDSPVPRATHRASQDNVVVLAGATTATNELTLTQTLGSVHVRWLFSDALECIDNGVASVQVTLVDSGNNMLVAPVVTSCADSSFVDPEDGQTKSGVLFEGLLLPDSTTFDVIVTGAATTGGPVIRQGTAENQTLAPGERRTINIELSPTTP